MSTESIHINSATLLMVASAVASARADSTNCLDPPARLVGCWPGDGNTNNLAFYNYGAANGWVNFGDRIRSTGSSICIFDSTRGREKRFYRVSWQSR